MIVVTLVPSLLPYQRIDVPKGDLTDSGHYYAWSPLFRYDAVSVPGAPNRLFVLHDGLLGSQMNKWNGKLSSLKSFHYQNDPRVVPFAALGGGAPDELIIGAAGGNEILASLFFKSKAIDAIEVNPATYQAVTHDLADYNGHVATAPGVNYVNDEGRSYLARRDEKYNLIWYPAPDSYSATNAATSGAFVLSESYLYTSEAVQDSLEHLRPGGIITTQFGEVDYDRKPTRTARYITTTRDALGELGIKDPARHIIVITSPTEAPASLSTILVSRTPFTAAQVDHVKASLTGVPGAEIRYAPGDASPGDPATKLATLHGSAYDRYVDDYPFQISPVTDNKPFFWHFESYSNVIKNFGDKIDPTKRIDLELGVGERVLLVLLAVAALFAIVFLLLPFVTIKKIWGALPQKCALGALLRRARARVHLLRDHAHTKTHAVPRVPDAVPDRHAGVAAAGHRRRRVAQRSLHRAPAPGGATRPCGDRAADRVLSVRAAVDHRRGARLADRSTRRHDVHRPRATRCRPGHLHAGGARDGGRTHRVPARVRRLGLGRQRLRVRGRLGALDHPGDDLRVQRRACDRARPLRGRSARAPGPAARSGSNAGRRSLSGDTSRLHRTSTVLDMRSSPERP